jgi:uncharacterized protein
MGTLARVFDMAVLPSRSSAETKSWGGPEAHPAFATAYQAALQRMLPRAVKIELILTEACNLGCSYCFEYDAVDKMSMSVGTARAAVEFAFQASRASPWVGISFMGGEPLLQFELIQTIVKYSRAAAAVAKKSISFDLQTNGVLIREEHAAYFRDHDVRYCLSLDGNRVTNDRHRRTLGGSGTFQIVAAKMKMLKRHQHWQGARMTIMPDDAGRLGENIRALHEELAINQFIIGFATHVDWSDRQIADYAEGLKSAFDFFIEQRVFKRSRRIRIGLFELGQLDEAYTEQRRSAWGCGAGSGRLAVSTDGTFHGCSKLAWGVKGGSANAPLPLGSVETGFSKPENRLKLLDHTETPRIKCHSCEIAAHCNGGCHAANFADTGNMYVPADYFCKLMFAQKHACDYARSRMKELGLENLYWSTDLPDLTDPHEPPERIYDDVDAVPAPNGGTAV